MNECVLALSTPLHNMFLKALCYQRAPWLRFRDSADLSDALTRFRLQVTLSSLNRHAVAVREDVGTPKATCMVKHFNQVFPEATLEPLVSLYEPVRRLPACSPCLGPVQTTCVSRRTKTCGVYICADCSSRQSRVLESREAMC